MSQLELSALRPLQDGHYERPASEAIRQARDRTAARDTTMQRNAEGLLTVEGKTWIPDEAEELIVRLLIMGHCGARAHRGADVLYEILRSEFAISGLKQLSEQFVNDCLFCKHVKGGALIQRPWNITHTTTRRNELLHMDFLLIGESYGSSRYLLVLKDDLTHFCELIACESANGSVAVSAVLDWNKRFGLPEMWVSDNGSYFRNTVMEDIKNRLGALQRFVPVYTPWLNGTVERLNRGILQVVRVLLLEYQLDLRNWEFLLPVVQSNLNHTPVRSLANKPPAEVFTGFKRAAIVNVVAVPRGANQIPLVVERSVDKFESELNNLRASLHEVRAEIADKKKQRQLMQSAARHGQTVTFTTGDFMLWSRADSRMQGQKLMVRWVGPFRVVDALSTSFMIEHLLTKERYDVHAIRLKHYADSMLDVIEELKHHVALQGINLGVRAVRGGRYNKRAKEWELLVSWSGLEDSEDSWDNTTPSTRRRQILWIAMLTITGKPC